MPQQITFRLNQLRCTIETDESGASEPYLWVTYFVLDGRNISQQDPVTTHTPTFNGFRRDMPDNVREGAVLNVPPFLANFSAEVDPGPLDIMMAGCVAALLEEDETPGAAMLEGHRAYSDEIHRQLNNLIRERIRTQNRSPLTAAEIKTISDAVTSRVVSAIKGSLTLGQQLFGNQDDPLGFTHVTFIGGEIRSRDLEFPEIVQTLRPRIRIPTGVGSSTTVLGPPVTFNRYTLSGSLTVGPVPPPPTDRCADLRRSKEAKSERLDGLRSRLEALQRRLATATPQAKPAIIRQIKELGPQISLAETELRTAAFLLKQCETGVLDPNPK